MEFCMQMRVIATGPEFPEGPLVLPDGDPLVNMANDHNFNQEYFDSVRNPAKNLVGEENRGWYVVATLLDFERSNTGAAIGLRNTVDDIVKYVQENPDGRVQDNKRVRLELTDVPWRRRSTVSSRTGSSPCRSGARCRTTRPRSTRCTARRYNSASPRPACA
jgi:hypothetical protein